MNEDLREQLSENPTLDSICIIIGNEAAANLSNVLGGRRVYFPYRPGEASPVAVAVGLENARKIGDVYGGAHMDVPIRPGKKARILKLLQDGQTVASIAQQMGCTERHVFQIKADSRDDTQINLFD